jgi:hypothetical protein
MPGIKRKVKVKKIPEGPRDPSLSATFRPGKVKGRPRRKLLTGRKLGGTLTSQGYKDRKDESIAMRDPKKRTKKQRTASRDESYGKFGHGTGKGKINKAKSGGVVKRKPPKVKKPAWMKGLSEDEIKSILGGPHPSGERRVKTKKSSKVRKAKAGGVVKKAGGGMTRQGLYPAEEARSGTMSEAKRKRYMKKGGSLSKPSKKKTDSSNDQVAWSLKYSKKKPPSPPVKKIRPKGWGGLDKTKKVVRKQGGKVSYRNIGGVIGGKMPSKDVIEYLYQIQTDKLDY